MTETTNGSWWAVQWQRVWCEECRRYGRYFAHWYRGHRVSAGCPHAYANVAPDGRVLCRYCGYEIVEEMGG
jgi:hypothetical protein